MKPRALESALTLFQSTDEPEGGWERRQREREIIAELIGEKDQHHPVFLLCPLGGMKEASGPPRAGLPGPKSDGHCPVPVPAWLASTARSDRD